MSSYKIQVNTSMSVYFCPRSYGILSHGVLSKALRKHACPGPESTLHTTTQVMESSFVVSCILYNVHCTYQMIKTDTHIVKQLRSSAFMSVSENPENRKCKIDIIEGWRGI